MVEATPLLFAENRGRGIGVGPVLVLELRFISSEGQVVAEGPRVEQQYLHRAFAVREDLLVVDPRMIEAARSLGFAPEVEEDGLGFGLHRVVTSRIVGAVVVVVPGRQEGAVRAERLELRARAQLFVLGAQLCHVLGVAVDVVTEIDEQIWIMLAEGPKGR